MEFVDTFLGNAREIAGYDPRNGAVLAVSGGPDSMALLHLHARLAAGRIVVAHLDHHLRPDSTSDAAFVAEQARELGAAFVLGHWEAHEEARGTGMEAAARNARYRFLAEVARDHHLGVVATGHHRDDQAETVLHRLLRGTGPDGLCGIHGQRPLENGLTLVRPLLMFQRSEIMAYLEQIGGLWREDPTNRDESNLRSVIRARLLPYLAQGVPEISRRLAGVARSSTGVKWPPRKTSPSFLTDLQARPVLLKRTLQALLPEQAPILDQRSVHRVRDALVRRRGTVDLGRGYRARVTGDTVRILTPEEKPAAQPPVALSCPGQVETMDGSSLIAGYADGPHGRDADGGEFIDADLFPPPYVVRSVRAGDRFHPLGFPRETTAHRFLAGQGVPRAERAECLVVLSGECVVLVVGHRISERAKITPGTRRTVHLARQ